MGSSQQPVCERPWIGNWSGQINAGLCLLRGLGASSSQKLPLKFTISPAKLCPLSCTPLLDGAGRGLSRVQRAENICHPERCLLCRESASRLFPWPLPLFQLHVNCDQIRFLPNSQICLSEVDTPHSSGALWKLQVNCANESLNLYCLPTLC